MPSVSTKGGTVDRIYPPHHEGIVRAVLWDEHSGGLLTGGEDSKVNLWDDPLSYGTILSNPIRKRELHDEDMDVDEQQVSRYVLSSKQIFHNPCRDIRKSGEIELFLISRPSPP